MKFSILIPVYNVEEYLRDCLKSVDQQTFTDYEVILVDDGSTDSSGIICDEKEKNTNYKIYHNSNHGLLFSRRFAVSKAVGEYIVNLDSDDLLTPNALEIINEKIEKYNCDCIIFGLKRVLMNKELEPYTSKYSEDQVFLDKRSLYLEMLSSSKNNSLCRKVVKKEIIDSADFSKYFNIDHGEDLIQSLEIYRNAHKTVLIPDCLYIYRMNPSSMVHTKQFKDLDLNYTVQKAVCQFIKKENVFSEEDNNFFGEKSIDRFVTTIIWVSSLDEPIRERYKHLKILSACDYVQNFLFAKRYRFRILGLRAWVFFLFKHKCYWVLLVSTLLINQIRGNEEK